MIAGHSLLLEGVASRLLDLTEDVELHTFDPQALDLLKVVAGSKPEVVLLDEQDPLVRERCALADLLRELPEARILLLNSERSDLQIITNRRIRIENSEALLDHILQPLA
jgi:DNA-binding NarL/FixJ family response regulator